MTWPNARPSAPVTSCRNAARAASARVHASPHERPRGCSGSGAARRSVRSDNIASTLGGSSAGSAPSDGNPAARASAILLPMIATNRSSTSARCSSTPATDQRSTAGTSSRWCARTRFTASRRLARERSNVANTSVRVGCICFSVPLTAEMVPPAQCPFVRPSSRSLR